MEKRVEKDSLGKIMVPKDAYWGATTQRALENFKISGLRFSRSFIRALGIVKIACAEANLELRMLSEEIGKPMIAAAKEVRDGQLDSHFPLDIFQTGSGTHTNMNANEVIANRASELMGLKKGSKAVHPNDHVNLSQSSNDVFPTAMHISVYEELENRLIPSLEEFKDALEFRAKEFKSILKSGRTHLMDATPVTLGYEFSTYASQIGKGIKRIKDSYPRLSQLPIGGTAVGTGVNAPEGFSDLAVKHISLLTDIDFRINPHKGEGISAHDSMVEVSGVLKTVAASLYKISNDIRWMASGPSSGLNELSLPTNEPGSSIMPGKVNPTQSEALMMACAQVIGNDTAITLGGLGGNFELNTMKPLIAYNLLLSIEIMANSINSFTNLCLKGLSANLSRLKEILDKNLMLVTALSPVIGYERAAEVAKEALEKGMSLREVVLAKKLVNSEELERLLDPSSMTGEK